jgi:hypothetical protein
MIEKGLGVKNVCLKNVISSGDLTIATRMCTKQGELKSFAVCSLILSNCSTGGSYTACSAINAASDKGNCHICETDLCNGSSKLNFNVMAILVPFAIVIFTKLF